MEDRRTLSPTMRNRISIDIETCPIDNAADYLDEIAVPGNYSKPESIDAYIEKAKADQLSKAGLDPDLCRIVAIGIQPEGHDIQTVTVNEMPESELIEWLWAEVADHDIISFNGMAFDFPVLLRRSLYLGVAAPFLPMNRYRHDGIHDLLQLLSFQGVLKFRSLRWYCRRLGLELPEDEIDGSGIAEAVANNDWQRVHRHLYCDVQMTSSLAARMGLFEDIVRVQKEVRLSADDLAMIPF